MISVDAYSRKARLAPALLVALPLGLTIVAWLPGAGVSGGALVGVLSTFGFTVLLAELGRDAGKRKEARLVKSWGGLPTVRFLRHRDGLSNAETRKRYHARLRALLPDLAIPNPEQEAARALDADRAYESCVEYLRERTRDPKRFALIFQENASYGFRRNLWAMKPVGLSVATAGLIATGTTILVGWFGRGHLAPFPVAATVINAVMVAIWTTRVTPEWVRMAADAYAQRLLAACEELTP